MRGAGGEGGLSGGGIIGEEGMGDGDGKRGGLGFRVFSTFVVYLLCFNVCEIEIGIVLYRKLKYYMEL